MLQVERRTPVRPRRKGWRGKWLREHAAGGRAVLCARHERGTRRGHGSGTSQGGAAMADGTNNATDLIPAERITAAILVVRGQRVILDADLAALYGVRTGRLNEAVKRNRGRFPADFVFRLTGDEWAGL